MGRYTVAPRADTDVDDILEYIAIDNFEAAVRFNVQLIELFELLADNPRAGRMRPDLGIGIRSFPHEKYLVVYRETGGPVEIVRVLHGARDLDEIFS